MNPSGARPRPEVEQTSGLLRRAARAARAGMFEKFGGKHTVDPGGLNECPKRTSEIYRHNSFIVS